MKLNPRDMQKTSQKLMEKLQDSDLRSRISVIWSQQSEIIIAAIAAFVVGILLLLVR